MAYIRQRWVSNKVSDKSLHLYQAKFIPTVHNERPIVCTTPKKYMSVLSKFASEIISKTVLPYLSLGSTVL